ncbi:hypothetical protein CEP52_017484 [Fusarium oligoseptatum]|uniref:Nucleoside phosphorylase domain-containing protein n=1 Tax=Fusarium oligoseptatum TaxID=2604345 RepID=A0A428RQK0_9HYPO|nr:hypothetical protein CEP52_017484 [Fusarium oligoseptatum]
MAYPRTSQADFPIAIICALKVEYDAVSLLVEFSDEDGDRFGTAPGDDNIYKAGRMGNVNIVLVHLRDKGTIAAAVATSHLRSSFPKLKLVFLVGVCGGVPTVANQEIILGDVAISKSVFEHDRGSQYPAGFQPRHGLFEPTQSVQSLLVTLETNRWHNHLIAQAAGNLKLLQANAASQGQQSQYRYPGTVNDCLFEYNYHHRHQSTVANTCIECDESSGSTCCESREISCEELGCSDDYAVQRDRLRLNRYLEEQGLTDEAQVFRVVFGRFASGDMVVKCGEHRDKIAKQNGITAFEMEGAGIWAQQVPCLIIKGVCDYADSHKNKIWQPYAAATAAATSRRRTVQVG